MIFTVLDVYLLVRLYIKFKMIRFCTNNYIRLARAVINGPTVEIIGALV